MRQTRKRARAVKFAILVVLLAVATFFLYGNYAQYRLVVALDEFAANTTPLDGAYVQDGKLYFYKDCDAVFMGITDDQAFSITQGLSGKGFSRPLTHDLFVDVADYYGVTVLHAKLDSIENGVYMAKILFYGNGMIYAVDSRPSDMAALSVRYGNPTAISNDLIENFTAIC